MRNGLIVLWILLCSIASAGAQVSVGIGFPGVNIGINLPAYPQMVAVPGYPVYYAPQMNSNYFFYDGYYWVYQRDNWYASTWYNGPWGLVSPDAVPLFVLRIPVRYYRSPPSYFHGWRSDMPPRWGDHWGNTWAGSHSGWDTWNHGSVPVAAPLPVYQRQYSGNRYPQQAQQQALQTQNYHYQPQNAVIAQPMQAQPTKSAPAPVAAQPVKAQPVRTPPATPPKARQDSPQANRTSNPNEREPLKPTSLQPGGPPATRTVQAPKGAGGGQRPAAVATPTQPNGAAAQHQPQQVAQRPPQQPQKAAPPREQQAQQPQKAAPQREQQAPQGQAKGQQGKAPEPESKQAPEKGREQGEPKGGGKN